MRYQIFSLQQKALVELGLNVEESLLLDWFLNWKDGNTMKREYIEEVNDVGYWLEYKNVIKELPILFKQPSLDMDRKELDKLLRNNKDKVARLLGGNLSKVLKKHKIVYKGKGAKTGSMIFITVNRNAIDMLKNKEASSTAIEKANDTNENLNCNDDNIVPQSNDNCNREFLENEKIENKDHEESYKEKISENENKKDCGTGSLECKNEKDYIKIAYDRCLNEIEGFESLEQIRKDFHISVMLRKIALE